MTRPKKHKSRTSKKAGKTRSSKQTATLLHKTIKENTRLKKQAALQAAGNITFQFNARQIDLLRKLALSDLIEIKNDISFLAEDEYKKDVALVELEKEKTELESIINVLNFE